MELTAKAVLYQFGAALAAGMSAMIAGAWISWPSSTLPKLKTGELGLKLDKHESSTMVALLDLGNIISPIPASFVMNIIGRKITLLSSAVLYVTSCILPVVGRELWMLDVARLLAGMGKGITFVVVPIFVAEISSNEIRGATSSVFITLLHTGLLFEYAIGPHVSYDELSLINLSIPAVFLISFVFLPESPYYMLMKHKPEKGRESLRKYRCVKKDQAGPGTPFDVEFLRIQANVEKDMANRGTFIDLLATKGSRRALTIVSLLACFQRASGITPTHAYTTSYIPRHGGGASPEMYMFIFSILNLVFSGLATPLVDTMGRKPLLLLSSLACGTAQGVTAVFYYLLYYTTVDTSSYSWVPYAALIVFGSCYSLGIGFIPSTMVGELFPTNIKSYAGCVSAILLAVTSMVLNKGFPLIAHWWGVHINFAIYAISQFLCFFYTIFFIFETKGKSFAEIQRILNNEPAEDAM